MRREHFPILRDIVQEITNRNITIAHDMVIVVFIAGMDRDGKMLSLTELAKGLRMDGRAFARSVERLEKAGLAKRIRQPPDRLHVLLQITEKGRNLDRKLAALAAPVEQPEAA